jgi:hypothetical protein
MQPRPVRFQLGGKRWTRRVVPYLKCKYGDCDQENRIIRIVAGQSARNEFDTDIHELLHGLFPWMEEWQVESAADDITALMFDRLHYRRGTHGSEAGV